MSTTARISIHPQGDPPTIHCENGFPVIRFGDVATLNLGNHPDPHGYLHALAARALMLADAHDHAARVAAAVATLESGEQPC